MSFNLETMEEDFKLQVCRLCLNLISDKNFLLLRGSLKDMLQVITTELNLDRTSNPVMCTDCSKSLQEIFVFKTNFFENEEKVEAKMTSKNNKLDLRDIVSDFCKRARKSKRINIQTIRVCRTCLKVINRKKFIDLNIETNSKLSSVLSSCIPEMDLRLTKNPVMCQICYDTLQKMECFKYLCNINESKIDAFSKTMSFDPLYKVNLHEVIQFSKNQSTISTTLNNCTDEGTIGQTKLTPTCTTIKMEPHTEAAEYSKEKCLIINCLDYVSVKMEPPDEDQVNVKEIGLKRRNRSNTLQTQGPLKKNKDKCENKIMTYCSDCDFKTKYKYNLRRHLIIAHKRKDIEVNKKFYQCMHCSFSTKWNIDLTRHLLSHVKPEALKCTRCPYSTNQNSQLIKHILSHVNADNIDKYRFLQLTKKSKQSKK